MIAIIKTGNFKKQFLANLKLISGLYNSDVLRQDHQNVSPIYAMWTDWMCNAYVQSYIALQGFTLCHILRIVHTSPVHKWCHTYFAHSANSVIFAQSVKFCMQCKQTVCCTEYHILHKESYFVQSVIFCTQCTQRGVQCTQTQRDSAWVRLAAHLIAEQCKEQYVFVCVLLCVFAPVSCTCEWGCQNNVYLCVSFCVFVSVYVFVNKAARTVCLCVCLCLYMYFWMRLAAHLIAKHCKKKCCCKEDALRQVVYIAVWSDVSLHLWKIVLMLINWEREKLN